mgnify:CR=1 FL=1
MLLSEQELRKIIRKRIISEAHAPDSAGGAVKDVASGVAVGVGTAATIGAGYGIAAGTGIGGTAVSGWVIWGITGRNAGSTLCPERSR